MRSKYFFMKTTKKRQVCRTTLKANKTKTSKDGQGFIRAFSNKKYYTYIALKTVMARAIF